MLEKSVWAASGWRITLANNVGLNWVKVIFSVSMSRSILAGSGLVTTSEHPQTMEARLRPVPPDVCMGMMRSHRVWGLTSNSAAQMFAL